jgi:hypothetical protein
VGDVLRDDGLGCCLPLNIDNFAPIFIRPKSVGLLLKAILGGDPLDVVYKFLKVGVVVQGGAHLHRFRVLPLLAVPHSGQHLFDPRVVGGLNDNGRLIVFVIDTSMPVMGVLEVHCRPVCLLQSVCHVESLLAKGPSPIS